MHDLMQTASLELHKALAVLSITQQAEEIDGREPTHSAIAAVSDIVQRAKLNLDLAASQSLQAGNAKTKPVARNTDRELLAAIARWQEGRAAVAAAGNELDRLEQEANELQHQRMTDAQAHFDALNHEQWDRAMIAVRLPAYSPEGARAKAAMIETERMFDSVGDDQNAIAKALLADLDAMTGRAVQ